MRAMPEPSALAAPTLTLAAARRRLWQEVAGIAFSAAGFGFVYGLTARNAGFSPIEAMAMSVLVFAGAAQFAAVGYVAGGLAWPGVILLTALINARHLLYSAALAPWLKDRSLPRRALMAHVLTDEAFALTIASTFIPWNVATLAGVLLGGQIADPSRYGLDVVFPAAMAGLAVGLVAGRREIVAAAVGGGVGVVVSLAIGPAVGIVSGGLLGPLAGMLLPNATGGHRPRGATLERDAPGSAPADAVATALAEAEDAVAPRDEAGLP
jgi:predicted branched-subunit amino acid permease